MKKELKSIVPPLKLCRKIPQGEFADSVLVWFFDGTDWWVNVREFDATGEDEYPAPTLPEIMEALDLAGWHCPTCCRQAYEWHVDCADADCEGLPEIYNVNDRNNPATAAMKLWLDLKDTEHV